MIHQASFICTSITNYTDKRLGVFFYRFCTFYTSILYTREHVWEKLISASLLCSESSGAKYGWFVNLDGLRTPIDLFEPPEWKSKRLFYVFCCQAPAVYIYKEIIVKVKHIEKFGDGNFGPCIRIRKKKKRITEFLILYSLYVQPSYYIYHAQSVVLVGQLEFDSRKCGKIF